MSNKMRFNLGKAGHLRFLDVGGNVIVKAGMETEAVIRGDQVEASEKGDSLNISAQGNIKAVVPEYVSTSFQKVHGNLTLKGLAGETQVVECNGELTVKRGGGVNVGKVDGDFRGSVLSGPVELDHVSGSVSVKNAQSVRIDSADGDVSARYLVGPAQVEHTNGELRASYVSGDITAGQVNGDMILKQIGGIVQADQVNGDAIVHGVLVPGKHHIKANGDIIIRWQPGIPVEVVATCKGEFRDRLNMEMHEKSENGVSAQIGSGGPVLILQAEGDIIMGKTRRYTIDFDEEEFEVDFEGDMEEFGEKLNARMDDLGAYFEEQFGPEFSAKIARNTEMAIEKAFKGLEKAQSKLRARFVATPPSPPPPPPAPKKSAQASEAEQLKILEMLEKGAISVEDAKTLLEALD